MRIKILSAVLLFLIIFPVVYFLIKQFSINPKSSASSSKITLPTADKGATYTVFQYKQEDLATKKELIKSNSIDDIMTAIRIGHVPSDGVMDYRSFSSINVKSFRINLDKGNWYQSINKYFNISEFPSSEEATLSNNTWKGFSYTEASEMYTKNGYACILLRPNRFGTTPYITCSNVLELSKNTQITVSGFMTTLFSQAGIDCEVSKCVFTETQEDYPLNKYGGELVSFDKSISRENDNELVKEVNKEAEESEKFFLSSGWKANLEQYTETERRWNKSALISIMIKAENDIFTCSHNITVMDLGKRNIIECSYKNDVLEKIQHFYNPYK